MEMSTGWQGGLALSYPVPHSLRAHDDPVAREGKARFTRSGGGACRRLRPISGSALPCSGLARERMLVETSRHAVVDATWSRNSNWEDVMMVRVCTAC